MRGLIVATNPIDAASTRYRVVQYLPRLAAEGIHAELRSFFPDGSSAALYSRGRLGVKLRYVMQGTAQRLRDLQAVARECDFMFIHREYFPLGWRVGWRQLQRITRPILYDFDDAMFLPQRRDRSGIWRLLERPTTTREIIELSWGVIAGNRFLADIARQWNPRVTVIPTSVDLAQYRVRPHLSDRRGPCVIGWIGGPSTGKYLQSLLPVFNRLAHTERFVLRIVGANGTVRMPNVPVEYRPWQLHREIEEFQDCDIGVYPLWNDDWSRGKCGFKAIQFMAVGVPVVASHVGANPEIVQDGVTGFLASSEEEWATFLTTLLRDQTLRQQMGAMGRAWVEQSFDVNHQAAILSAFIRTTVNGQREL